MTNSLPVISVLCRVRERGVCGKVPRMLRAALLTSTMVWACSETLPSSGSGLGGGGQARFTPLGAGQGGDAAFDASGGAGPRAVAGAAVAGGAPAGGESGLAERGAAGSAGAGGQAGAGADAGTSANAAAGGSTGGEGGATTRLCALAALDGQDPLDQSGRIASSYLQVLFSECAYKGLNCGVDVQGLPEFSNQLRPYGYNLWHCGGSTANGFKLVYPSRKVTQADAEALIDLYVTLTARRLLLSDADAVDLRQELLALMVSSLDPDAPAVSVCDSNGICPLSAPGSGGGGSAGGVNAQAGAG